MYITQLLYPLTSVRDVNHIPFSENLSYSNWTNIYLVITKGVLLNFISKASYVWTHQLRWLRYREAAVLMCRHKGLEIYQESLELTNQISLILVS